MASTSTAESAHALDPFAHSSRPCVSRHTTGSPSSAHRLATPDSPCTITARTSAHGRPHQRDPRTGPLPRHGPHPLGGRPRLPEPAPRQDQPVRPIAHRRQLIRSRGPAPRSTPAHPDRRPQLHRGRLRHHRDRQPITRRDQRRCRHPASPAAANPTEMVRFCQAKSATRLQCVLMVYGTRLSTPKPQEHPHALACPRHP
jgi:hypothetical protein